MHGGSLLSIMPLLGSIPSVANKMKIQEDFTVSHDNGCRLGKIYIDPTFGRVFFKPGKDNHGSWVCGGSLDSNDMRKLAKTMDGIAGSLK